MLTMGQSWTVWHIFNLCSPGNPPGIPAALEVLIFCHERFVTKRSSKIPVTGVQTYPLSVNPSNTVKGGDSPGSSYTARSRSSSIRRVFWPKSHILCIAALSDALSKLHRCMHQQPLSGCPLSDSAFPFILQRPAESAGVWRFYAWLTEQILVEKWNVWHHVDEHKLKCW